jgi:phosphatidylglycerophosphatase C
MDSQFLPYHLYAVKKRLVLFDFDGTITTKDTFLEFIKFYHGTSRFLWGFLWNAPYLALMVFKFVPNWRGKEKMLTWFFAGETIDDFNRKSDAFCKQVVPNLIRPKALAEIERHRMEGATVVVVSASAENWIAPWCRAAGLDCIATQLQVVDNKLTGKINGFNCYGPEKENRLRSCYALDEFEEVYAYGDSRGDTEMLALAQQRFYKPFRS